MKIIKGVLPFLIQMKNCQLHARWIPRQLTEYGSNKMQCLVRHTVWNMSIILLPEGEEPFEIPTFRRSNAFDTIGEEVRAVREGVGLNEVHNFGKYEVSGPGAHAYLDKIMAGRIPKVGRLSLNPMLSYKGRIIGDFTVAQVRENVFQVTASFGAQAYHMRWFETHLPEEGVVLKNISKERIGFQIAGPKAQELLSRVTLADVSTEAFPFLSIREIDVGQCQAIVQRVSYTGDRGYEIYVPWHQQAGLYEILTNAGEDLGLRPFGMRAMMSLRLDKSFGSWMREFKPDYTPLETGLDRFVDYKKAVSFIGKEAAMKEMATGVPRKLCTFKVDAKDADVVAWEPIWHDGKVVGYVTSGGYSHYAKTSVAFGFLPVELIEEGQQVEIEILGEMISATLYSEPLFDPSNKYLRG